MVKFFATRTQDEMKDVLMNLQGKGPDVHYYMIRGGSEKKNITVWESGTVGGEYIKTYGHYHVGKLSETYEVLAGEGYILLQRRRQDSLERVSPSPRRRTYKRETVLSAAEPIDDEIVEFRAIKVKAGSKVFIPPEYGHFGVNTGDSWLVTSDDSPVDFGEKKAVSAPSHADYAPFKKLRGGAYYVVKKNGKPEFIKNPFYKKVPPIKFE